ncbi:MAG: HAD family hydrolase [Anaerolineae bacterium]|nr:HAD family hydrolase [Anaerolineae bacterium]MCB9129495.1 HAD family hydrolase [Anaerolineales bacterium]MCB0231861.1 HAD family hydrolase [Anaerolineae bacterium]MCB0232991.1 HAD family hydrolase [Anaerolineae bacterium]MCB0239695.1 HAD family hydrolase [Anaerolineae bacterium]
MSLPTRETAWDLVCEWVVSDSLRKHMLAVEAAMRAYARKYDEDEELWGITGLVHDLDFERYPDMDDPVNGHPRTELRLFHELDYPEALIHAVEGHAPYLGIPRAGRMDSALVAVDELTGLIMAVGYVRPSKDLRDVTVKSVRKKWKDKAFAAAINRHEIEEFTAELGEELDEHIALVLSALQDNATVLGLDGSLAKTTG